MNKIEQGIVDATDTAEAAVPKSTVTTAGDIIYGTGASAVSRLGIGTARYVLATNSGQTAPQWIPSPTSVLTGTGDLLYSSAANTLARLAAGTNGQVLTMVSGLPAWAAGSGITITKYVKTSEKDVNNTVAKTDLLNGEITIAGNAMSSSGAIQFACGGDFINNTGSQGSIRLELKLGSTVLWDSGTSDGIDSNAQRGAWYFHGDLQALGATNSQRGGGAFLMTPNAGRSTTTGTGNFYAAHTGTSAYTMAQTPFLTVASAEDMTTSKTFTFSVTLSTGSVSLGMRLEYATILVF